MTKSTARPQPSRGRSALSERLARQVRAALACALIGVASAGLADSAQDGWRLLYQERGIAVSVHEEPGVDLPGMRGQAQLNADVLHVLAILLDDRRSTEWAKGADETHVLKKLGARSQLIYARSRQPWPVRDRDLIMRRTVEVIEPGRAYRVHLICTPDERPALEDVVRVRRCETNFVLRALDAAHTSIDYRVQADPGGKIPAWLVRRASRSIPLDTLLGLAKQVELTRGKYKPAEAWLYASK